MKTFKYLVNGLEVEAKYDEEDIDKVYKPLLNHWYDLYKQKQCRIVIFIAGCPGSGKSTFVSFLEYLFNQMDFDCKLQTVGMDGFHYYNEELDKMNLRKEKGSPRTFNVEKLKQKIIQTKKEDCYWPYYSRKLHDPIENQIFVHSEIIIIEGNYLLLKDEPWNQLERLCDKVYCHYADQKYIEEHQGKDVVDEFVYDEKGELGYTWFDANDLPPFTSYEVEGVENHHQFDLGDGYIVELIHLPGHTPGQSGYLDHQTGCFFIGDVTSAFGGEAWDVYPEFCTINALRDALQDFMPRLEEVSGVFPGHGTIDLHPKTLKYILDTANRVIYHPEWYDTKVDFFGTPMYAKFIYQQGSDLKYTKSAVIKEEDPEEREF